MRRVVVTGLGVVTPLAASVAPSWSRLFGGSLGLRRLSNDVIGDLPANCVPGSSLFEPLAYSTRAARLARETRTGLLVISNPSLNDRCPARRETDFQRQRRAARNGIIARYEHAETI
jgi:3-oxoacyl-(acyl-carrier-protein) synthase